MDFKRPHPINILESTTKYFFLLLLPLVRGFLTFRGGFYAWLSGAWFDLLILTAILMMGFLRWICTRYYFDKQGIYINHCFIINYRCYLPFDRLSMVYAEYPFYFRPFGAVRIKADTDGGYLHTTDFSVTLSRKEAARLFEASQAIVRSEENIKKIYHPQWFYVALLSLITSNTLTGVLFASTFVSQSGNLLGKEFEEMLMGRLTDLARALAFGLPPAAALTAYVILGGWLISFLMNIIRHIKFNVIRQGKNLEIKTGVITTRYYSIQTTKINLIEIRQSLTTKLLGFFTVFIHCSGYGKQKNELSVLIPAADKYEARRNLNILLPEIPLVKKKYKPKLRTLSRFLIPPVTIMICVFLVFRLLYLFFPSLRLLFFFMGIMGEIPSVWWLFVKIASFFHTGIGKENGVYTLYYTYAYAFFTTSIPEHKISQVYCRQSLFQKMADCCDVIIFSYSEGKKRLVVPNIHVKEVNQIFDLPLYPVPDKQKRKGSRFHEKIADRG